MLSLDGLSLYPLAQLSSIRIFLTLKHKELTELASEMPNGTVDRAFQ